MLLDWFDLAAEARQAPAADLLQHSGVAPFAVRAPRSKFTFEQLSLGTEGA